MGDNPLIAKYGRGTTNIPPVENSPNPSPESLVPPLNHSGALEKIMESDTKPPQNPLIQKYGKANPQNYSGNASELIPAAIGGIGKLLDSETYYKMIGVPEGPAAGGYALKNPIGPDGKIEYGNEQYLPKINARQALSFATNAAAPYLFGKATSTFGEAMEGYPYKQLNEMARQKGGMPVQQIFKEEGLIPKDYKQMYSQIGELQNKKYPSAMAEIADKIKGSGVQMEPPESVFEQLQSKINGWKKSKTRVDAANVLQEDLDETIKKLQNGDFTNYGDVKSGVDKVLSPEQMGIVQSAKKSGIESTYNKMKGEALRYARANAAEAVEPGLGQQVFDIGNKQQTLNTIGKKVGQKAIAESGSPTISTRRWIEKLYDKPGLLIKGGKALQGVGNAIKNPGTLSTWELMQLYNNQDQGQ